MIAWSIDAALKSGCFDRVIVSTDDNEIAQVALSYGAEVPFIRPIWLAGDDLGNNPVIKHAVSSIIDDVCNLGFVCCIYATAPFVTPDDLKRGLETLVSTGSDFSFAVTSYAFPIQRTIRINSENIIEMVNPEHFHTRSQDLDEVWHDAGQFYWGKAEAWLNEGLSFGAKSSPLILPRYQVQDIDTYEDWRRAELLFKALYS